MMHLLSHSSGTLRYLDSTLAWMNGGAAGPRSFRDSWGKVTRRHKHGTVLSFSSSWLTAYGMAEVEGELICGGSDISHYGCTSFLAGQNASVSWCKVFIHPEVDVIWNHIIWGDDSCENTCIHHHHPFPFKLVQSVGYSKAYRTQQNLSSLLDSNGAPWNGGKTRSKKQKELSSWLLASAIVLLYNKVELSLCASLYLRESLFTCWRPKLTQAI